MFLKENLRHYLEQILANAKLQLVKIIQVLCMLLFFSIFVMGYVIAIPFLVALLFTNLYHVPLAYVIWMCYDYSTPFTSGRTIKTLRRLKIWNYIAGYFPITLHKTVDLDPKKNYIFCTHPHGVIGLSHMMNFLTEATGFSKKFPGIKIYPLTLDINFTFPVFRELFTALGCGGVRRESVHYKLTKCGPGQAVVIVTGGAAEAKLADPENPYRLKTTGRKGYVREALLAGASLVPVISFGESQMYQVVRFPKDSLLERFQDFIHRSLRFVPLIFHGNFGILPHRVPINTVVGEPIDLPRLESPTQQEIGEWHAKYLEALQNLFHKNKERFGVPGKELELS